MEIVKKLRHSFWNRTKHPNSKKLFVIHFRLATNESNILIPVYLRVWYEEHQTQPLTAIFQRDTTGLILLVWQRRLHWSIFWTWLICSINFELTHLTSESQKLLLSSSPIRHTIAINKRSSGFEGRFSCDVFSVQGSLLCVCTLGHFFQMREIR